MVGVGMSGQRVGYQRVSSLEQNPARQLEGIPLDQTFTDRLSGKDVDRPQLGEMLRFVRAGDTVTVHSVDRLARNLVDLRRIVSDLTGRGVRVEFVKEQLSFTGEDNAMAQLLLSVMGAFGVRAVADPGTPTGRCRAGQGTGRLPRPETLFDRRAGG